MSNNDVVRLERDLDGRVARLTLARPPGNILDADMVAALRSHVASLAEVREVTAVILEGEGTNFSFGASVEEHLPDRVAGMLDGFHGLFRDLISSGLTLISVVRGNCLGGGLELAAYAHRVFAAPDARLGQPEINLGVFAPVASLVLPRRVGQSAADDLLLTGRRVDALEALRIGLVDEVDEDPSRAATRWVEENLLAKSSASLRFAARAARSVADAAFLDGLTRLERLYLGDLMTLHDPTEGLQAFLEKRRPEWRHE